MIDIWKKYNISLILVLPLLYEITNNINIKHYETQHPFMSLAMKYGLINTYMLNENNEFNNSLFIKFDKKEVMSNKNITNSSLLSFNDLVISSDYFIDIQFIDDYIIYEMKLPDKYENDFELILDGKYSSLSDEYKKEISYKERNAKMPKSWEGDDKYIIINDLGYAVSKKANKIKNWFQDYFGETPDDDKEYYIKIHKDNERLK